ncbi:hypothetical protein [Bacillus sp. OK048]|uniref:hypothetical protein n=1 Tax=Bacillus sp. OK048 TaxID=1882761 RepID=UPI00088A344C|nr:hypothetical protein [Bacillus sp. OK048]SDN53406.1 hypothetical protein SAMN05443253_11393 [Bacillus sp. OK048]
MNLNCCPQAVPTSSVEVANLPLTAFKDLRSTELLPVAGWTFNYNINSDLIRTTLTGSGTATASNSMAVLQTGAAAASSAKIETIKALRYTPGLGGLVRCTAIFTTGVANSTQIIGVGDSVDGFFFGFNGAAFGVLRRQNGTDNWIPQTSWNMDKFNRTGLSGVTLDPTKGNVYTIEYQWLGFGAISFFIENPATGFPTLVHIIQYANANTIPSIFNPTLPVMAQVINTTNASNLTLRTSSAMGMIEGNGDTNSLVTVNSFSNSKQVSAETSILTLRNNATFQGKTNRVRVQFSYLSINCSGGNTATVRLVVNATLGGTPTYINISPTTSVVAADIAGTTVTGGSRKMTTVVNSPGDAQISIIDQDLEIGPGDTLTVSGASSANTTVTVGITWNEMW